MNENMLHILQFPAFKTLNCSAITCSSWWVESESDIGLYIRYYRVYGFAEPTAKPVANCRNQQTVFSWAAAIARRVQLDCSQQNVFSWAATSRTCSAGLQLAGRVPLGCSQQDVFSWAATSRTCSAGLQHKFDEFWTFLVQGEDIPASQNEDPDNVDKDNIPLQVMIFCQN